MKTILFVAFPLVFAFAAFAKEGSWDSSKASGSYVDDSNWSEGLPKASERATFGFWSQTDEITDYTVTFPAETTNDTSSTYLTGLRDGQSITFDTTTGCWYKGPGVATLTKHPLYLGACGLANADFLRFHNGNVIDVSKPAFLMSNALLRVSYSAETGSFVDFRQGIWNWYDPFGLMTDTRIGLHFGREDTNVVMKVREGTKLRGGELRVFGGVLDIEGGQHYFSNVLYVGGNSTSYASRTPVLNISGGRVDLDNNLCVGGAGCVGLEKATLAMSGESKVVVGGERAVNVGTSAGSTAILEMSGNSYLTNWILRVGSDGNYAAKGNVTLADEATIDCAQVFVGTVANSRGDLFMAGSSRLSIGGFGTSPMYALTIGSASGSTGRVHVAGNATIYSNPSTTRYIAIAGSQTSFGELKFSEQAKGLFGFMYLGFPGAYNFSLADNACVTAMMFSASWSSPSTGSVHIAGNSSMRIEGQTQLGHKGYTRFELSDNARFSSKAQIYYANANDGNGYGEAIIKDSSKLSGSSSLMLGAAKSVKPTVLKVQDNANVYIAHSTEIKGTDTCLDLAGGKFTTGSGAYEVKVCGTQGKYNGVKVSGGEHIISYANGIMVLDAGVGSGTVGRLDLNGGSVAAIKVYGGNGAAANGGAGSAELRADGGKLVALKDGEVLLGKFDVAELGEGGLAFEVPSSLSVSINQSFTDASGSDGIVKKTGAGTLVVSKNSTHAKTRVSEGTLVFGEGVAQFGKVLEVEGGVLDVASRSVSVEGLKLEGTLRVDANTRIHVADGAKFAVTNGILKFVSSPSLGDYAGIFEIDGEIGENAFDGLVVVDPDGVNRYSFSTATADGVTTVTIKVKDAASCEDIEWTGGKSASWSDAANWSGSQVPGIAKNAVFPSGASIKQVEIDALSYANSLKFGAGDWTLCGDGQINSYGIVAQSGAHIGVSSPVAPRGIFMFDVAAGASIDFSSPFARVAAGELRKTGSGLLSLEGTRRTDGIGWSVQGGTMRVKADGALEGEGQRALVTVGPATLSITNNCTIVGDVVCDNGANALVATVNAATDAAISGTLSVVGGGFAKTGKGKLTVNYKEGSYYVGPATDVGYQRNISPHQDAWAGEVVMPETGDSPSGADAVKPFGGFNVIDGEVELNGAGAEKTVLTQRNWTLIGLRNSAITADARLRLSALTWKDVGDYRRFVVGCKNYGSEGIVRPALQIDDGAFVTAQGLFLGIIYPRTTYPTLAITNSVLEVLSQTYLGVGNTWSPNSHPTVRIGEGGVLRSKNKSAARAYGLMVSQNVDIEVDGGLIDADEEPNGVMFTYTACGRILFKNGGRLKTAGFSATHSKHENVSNLVVAFDRGVLEINSAKLPTSEISAPGYRCLVSEAGGIEIAAGSGIEHTLHFPLKGEGKVVKTGSGKFVFGGARDVKFLEAGKISGTNDSDVAVAEWTGETIVREGTLQFDVPAAATTNITVCAGATLDLGDGNVALKRVCGNGTVANGALSGITVGAADGDGLLFENVELSGRVKVDFGVGEGSEAPEIGSVRRVMRFASCSTEGISSLRGINCGRNIKPAFSIDSDGYLQAQFDSAGVVLIVR